MEQLDCMSIGGLDGLRTDTFLLLSDKVQASPILAWLYLVTALIGGCREVDLFEANIKPTRRI